MAPTDQPRKQKPIVLPAIRDRFVMRARHLKAFPAYRQMLERERAAWDERFPRFPIGRPGLPPDETMAEHGPFMVAYPPPLGRGVDEVHALVNDGSGTHPDDTAIFEAATEWIWLMQRLAKEWWPAEIFPVWSTWNGHPAVGFVSACLVWRLEVVSEEWIVRTSLGGAAASAYNPERGPHPLAVYWRTYATAMDEAYTAAAESGRTIDPDELRALRRTAGEQASEQESGAYQKDMKDWFHYVPVFPGMTSTDWRAMERWVLATLNARFGPNPLVPHARRLKADGMSARRIAIELGISERQAGRLLAAEASPPASSCKDAGGQAGAGRPGGTSEQ